MFGQGDRELPPPYTATAASSAASVSMAVAHASTAHGASSSPSASASRPPWAHSQSAGLTAAFAAVFDGRPAPVQHQHFQRPALDCPIDLSNYDAPSSSQSYGQIINVTAAAATVIGSLEEVPCAQFDDRNASRYQQQYQQHDQYQHYFQNHQNQDIVFSHDCYHHHSQPVLVPSAGSMSWTACLTCGGATYYMGSSPFLSFLSPEEVHVLKANNNRHKFRQIMQENMKLAISAMLQGRMTFLQTIIQYRVPRTALRKKVYQLLQPRHYQYQITPPELLNLLTALADSEKPKPRGRGAYRKYDPRTLEEAAAAVLRGDMSVLHAGHHYSVPSSTIGNLVREMKRRQADGRTRPRRSADDQQNVPPSPAQSVGQPRQESSHEQ